jgi:hypothetical protein
MIAIPNIIYKSSGHLQRKEGDGNMQQIIKLKFSCNYINQNARPLQTIQHKKQNPSTKSSQFRQQPQNIQNTLVSHHKQ